MVLDSNVTQRIMAKAQYLIVIPAKAGIHLDLASGGSKPNRIKMDPGFRRDDERGRLVHWRAYGAVATQS
jgi:hypothetical protein